MPSQNELEIILSLTDNASDEFKRINRDAVQQVENLKTTSNRAYGESKVAVDKLTEATKFYKLQTDTLGQSVGYVRSELSVFNSALSQGAVLTSEQMVRYEELKNKMVELGNNGEQAAKKIDNSFKEASRGLQAFRRSMFIITAALAVMIKGLNDAAQYNEEAKQTSDNFNRSLKTLSATLGQVFAPAIQGLTFVIDGFRQTIEAALGGFIKLFSFVFEFLSQLPVIFKNIFDNVKNVFTKDEDPIGIVEAFKQSFDRALQVANIATDQIIGKIEETRSKIETGQTLEVQKSNKDVEVNAHKEAEKSKSKASQDRATLEASIKAKAVSDTKSMFQAIASENKAAGVAFKAISIVETIIATAKAVAKALPNIPLSVAVGAIGAAQVAMIASQKFHSGGMIRAHDGLAVDEVPIIAQSGEGILSRRGMANLGGEGALNALNKGASAVGNTIQIIIQQVDMSSNQKIQEVAEMLGFEFERITRAAR